MKAFLMTAFFFLCNHAGATELTLRARGNDNLSDFYFSQAAASSSASSYLIRMNVSCFGINNLNVTNPVSPTGLVRMNIGIGPASTPATKTGGGDFVVEFPGWLALKKDSDLARSDIVTLDLSSSTMPNALTAAFATQNTVLVRPPASAVTGLTGPTYPRAQTMGMIKYINFEQDIQARGNCWGVSQNKKPSAPPGWLRFLSPSVSRAGGGCCEATNPIKDPTDPQDLGFGQPACNSGQSGWDMNVNLNSSQIAILLPIYKQFMGKDGPLNGEWKSWWSSDYKTLLINVAFPGEMKYCGSYYSPLMLFFDARRPGFTARVDFEIHPQAKKTYWPEKNAPGYFLVMDRDNNGRIDDWTELFGDDKGAGNGFEKLRELDSNGDGVIDRKDRGFHRLRLWQDRTGTGVSRPADLHTLEELGVKAISLKYTYDRQVTVGKRAILREKAEFIFDHGKGNQKGEVVDVWLSN